MRTTTKILLTVAILLGAVRLSYGQTNYGEHNSKIDQISLNSLITDEFAKIIEYPSREIIIRKNLLTVKLASSSKVLSQADWAGVEIQAVYTGSDETYTQSLALGKDQSEAYWFLRLPKTKDVQALSFRVKSHGFGGILNDNNIEVSFLHELEYGFSDINSYEITIKNAIVDTKGKQVLLSLEENLIGADSKFTAPYTYYQVEAVRLFSLDEDNPRFELDWRDSSPILVSSTLSSENSRQVVFPLTEGEGYYAYRLRPVSEHTVNGLANNANLGRWTAPELPDNLLLTEELINNKGFCYLSDNDAAYNYIYSRIFSEAGKTKETVTYADKLLNARQSLTYLPSQNKVIRTATIKDYSGRPVVSTLPVPDAQAGRDLSYKPGLVKNSEGQVFGAKDIEKPSYNAVASLGEARTYVDPLTGEELSYQYYSANNPEGVASDEGYGYTRATFYNDGSGRVYEQSGVGDTHKIGSGHTTRTLYGSASQSELDYLFGEEAPQAKNVFKTYVIDPNNVVSVSYTNKEGQVIATGLSALSNFDTQLQDLPSDNNEVLTISDVADKSVLINNSLQSTKRIIVPSDNQLISLSYKVKQGEIGLECGSVNLNCNYKLTFEVYRVSTPSELQEDELHSAILTKIYPTTAIEPISLDQTTIDSEGFYAVSTEGIQLEKAGTYIFTKKIVPINPQASEVSNSRQQVMPVLDLISGWLDKVTTLEELELFYTDLRNFSDVFNTRNISELRSAYPEIGENFFVLYEEDPESFGMVLRESSYIDSETNQEKIEVLGFALSTTCCSSIAVPIDWIPPFDCPEIINNPTEVPDFLNWASLRLRSSLVAAKDIAPNKVKDYILENYFSGYNEDIFDRMVYHMLTDTYYGNGNIKDQTTGEVIAAPQYTCDELFECWSGTVSALKQQLDNINLDGLEAGSTDVSAQFDDRKDDDAQGHDSFIDGKALMPKKGILKKWRGKRRKKKVSKKVREVSANFNPQLGASPGDLVSENFVMSFIQCAGFQFAKVIDGFDAEPLPEDKSSTFKYYTAQDDPSNIAPYKPNAISYQEFLYIVANTPLTETIPYIPVEGWEFGQYLEEGQPSTFKAYFPNVKNPIYAFKYFQYDGRGDLKYTALENSICYTDPNDCFVVDAIDGKIQGSLTMHTATGITTFVPMTEACCIGIDGSKEDCVEYSNYPATGDSKLVVADFCDMGQNICGLSPVNWRSEHRLMFYNSMISYKIADDEDNEVISPIQYSYEDLSIQTSWYQLKPIDENEEQIADDNGYPTYINQYDYDASIGSNQHLYDQLTYVAEDGNNMTVFPLLSYIAQGQKLDCQTDCESKRQEVEMLVFEELSKKCYDIDGCYIDPTGNVILSEDVAAIVDAIIEDCKANQCDITTFTYEVENCRTYDTPKISTHIGPNIVGEPAIQFGVSGNISDGSFGNINNTDEDAIISEGTFEFNGVKYYRFKKYVPNTTPKRPYNLSYYEAVHIDQVENWQIDIVFPCKCSETECIDEPVVFDPNQLENDTYVKPADFQSADGLEQDSKEVISPIRSLEVVIPPSSGNGQ